MLVLRIVSLGLNLLTFVFFVDMIIEKVRFALFAPRFCALIACLALANVILCFFSSREGQSQTATDFKTAFRYLALIGNALSILILLVYLVPPHPAFLSIVFVLLIGFIYAKLLRQADEKPARETASSTAKSVSRTVLYSSQQIGVATFFGGLPAGIWFMTRNYKNLGYGIQDKLLLWVSGLMMVMGGSLILNYLPKFIPVTTLAVFVAAWMKNYAAPMDKEINLSIFHGARKASSWYVAAITIAVMVLELLVITFVRQRLKGA